MFFVGTAGSVCRCSGAVVVFDWCSHHDSFKKERLLPSTCSDEVFRSIANRHESGIKHNVLYFISHSEPHVKKLQLISTVLSFINM